MQQVYAGARYYRCDKAMVISNSTFTKAAKELAAATGVILWENVGREYVAAKDIFPSVAKTIYSVFTKLLILLGLLDTGICIVNFGYDFNSLLILLRGVLALIGGIIGALDGDSFGIATTSAMLFLCAFVLNAVGIGEIINGFSMAYYIFGLAALPCYGPVCKPKKRL